MALQSAIGAEPLSEWIFAVFFTARRAGLDRKGRALRAGTGPQRRVAETASRWSEGGNLLPSSRSAICLVAKRASGREVLEQFRPTWVVFQELCFQSRLRVYARVEDCAIRELDLNLGSGSPGIKERKARDGFSDQFLAVLHWLHPSTGSLGESDL